MFNCYELWSQKQNSLQTSPKQVSRQGDMQAENMISVHGRGVFDKTDWGTGQYKPH